MLAFGWRRCFKYREATYNSLTRVGFTLFYTVTVFTFSMRTRPMADLLRLGDTEPAPQRRHRLFKNRDDGCWYFMTREGAPVGPFNSEVEAQGALNDFLEFIRLADLQTLANFTQSLSIGRDGGCGSSGSV